MVGEPRGWVPHAILCPRGDILSRYRSLLRITTLHEIQAHDGRRQPLVQEGLGFETAEIATNGTTVPSCWRSKKSVRQRNSPVWARWSWTSRYCRTGTKKLQKKPLNAEAEAEIHHEKTRVMDRLEFAVEVVVDTLTHQKRRRREGKTDFHACKKMTQQTGHKYNSKKYCLAVRFTNRKVIVQVAYAVILGDKTVAQVTSTELPIRTVLEHRSAVYLTGFSGCLTKCGVGETFKGTKRLMTGSTMSRTRRTTHRVRSQVCSGRRVWSALKRADGEIFTLCSFCTPPRNSLVALLRRTRRRKLSCEAHREPHKGTDGTPEGAGWGVQFPGDRCRWSTGGVGDTALGVDEARPDAAPKQVTERTVPRNRGIRKELEVQWWREAPEKVIQGITQARGRWNQPVGKEGDDGQRDLLREQAGQRCTSSRKPCVRSYLHTLRNARRGASRRTSRRTSSCLKRNVLHSRRRSDKDIISMNIYVETACSAWGTQTWDTSLQRSRMKSLLAKSCTGVTESLVMTSERPRTQRVSGEPIWHNRSTRKPWWCAHAGDQYGKA